jgi:poly-gamma-glutamate synthesis protein (capsule biosynthesis protein)
MSKRLLLNLFLLSITIGAGIFVYSKNQSLPKKTENGSTIILKPVTVHKIEKVVELLPPKKPEVVTSTVSLLAVGDIMLDRSVMLKTQAAKDYNHPFLLIDPLFKEYELHLGNLEGPITTSTSVSNGKGGARFMFTFSPNFVEPLKNRFQFLSLANNHASNFGQKGIDQTRKYLGDAGVHFFGDANNVTEFVSVTSTYNGITLGFVGYHQLVETGFENVIAEVKRIKPLVDVVIVMPHWGVEYITEKPSSKQVEDAHALVDAGADSIIGAHPHVVEPIEIYKEKTIFYSLGNFVFDQYFSEETMTGLAVGLKIEKANDVHVEYTLIPLEINGVSQPFLAGEKRKQKLLEAISKNSNVSDDLKEKIKAGKW